MNSAKNKPNLREDSCCAFFNLPVTMDIKMILSTPNTISKMVKVSKLIHASAVVKMCRISIIV
jgi:hypothetical protein